VTQPADHPEFIGRYRIDALYEHRGAETLYTGFDTKVQRAVMLRVLFRHKVGAREFALGASELFMAAEAAGRLSPRAVLHVLDVGETHGAAYLVSERFPGKSVASMLKGGARVAAHRAVDITANLLWILDHVHGTGILHRNVNPGCVLVRDDVVVKLADFDLAWLREPAQNEATGARMMSGKHAVMAPEQIVGSAVDERTDLFQVGVLLYRMLTGLHPFPGPGAWSAAKQTLELDPPAPSSVDGSIPQELDEIVQVALAKNPEQRYSSAREFTEAFMLMPPAPARS
jgi:serine/threonine protein kinase